MKHIKHFKIFLIFLLVVSLLTVSCSNLFDTLSDVKITYTSVLGDAPSTKYVKANYVLTEADLPRLVQKGYSFKDWYIGDRPILPGHVITDDTILKGKWDSNKYKIKFDNNGGNGSLDTIENCEFGYKIKLPPVQGKIYRDGYYFIGWTTTKDGTGKLYPDGIDVMNLSTENNDIVTLYAKWSKVAPNMVTVYYASQLGTKPTSIQKFVGSPISESELPVLEAEGYEFLGWYYGPDKIPNGYQINQDIVLTANWRKIGSVANVIFDNSGEVDFQDTVRLSCSTKGADIYYTINGETSTRKQYKESEPISITEDIKTIEAVAYKEGMKVSDVSTASFSIKKYTVSFKTNGSKEEIKDKSDFKKGDTLKFSELPSVKREKYEFLGWYLNGEKVEADSIIEGNVVLVAQWQQHNKVSNVMFSKNSESDIMVDVGDKIYLTCPTAGAEIYYTTNGSAPTISSTKYDPNNPIVIDKDVVIKAIAKKSGLENSDEISNSYKIKTYQLIFNTNGGNETPLNRNDLKKGNSLEKVNLPIVTKTNCTFLGWVHNGKLITETEPLLIQGDTILVAQWQEIGKTANVMFSSLNSEVDNGDVITLSCTTPGADIFYTSDSGSEQKYDANTKITITEDCIVTAYAKADNLLPSEKLSSKYTVKTYSVTLNGNGIDNPSYAKRFKKGDTLSISDLPNISDKYSNHEFLGWYYNGAKIKDSMEVTGNITLVAQWREIGKVADVLICPITNSSSKINAVDYLTPVTLTCPTEGATIHYTTDGTTPTKESPTYTDNTVLCIDNTSKNTVIKAIALKQGLSDSDVTSSTYCVKTYTVTVFTNGADNVKDDVLTCTGLKKGEKLSNRTEFIDSLKKLQKTNYTLDGFYNAEGKKVDKFDEVNDNTSLFAKWKQEVVTIESVTGLDKIDSTTTTGSSTLDRGDKITITASPSTAVIYYSFDNKDMPDTWIKYDSNKGIIVDQRDDFVLQFHASKKGLEESKTIRMNYKVQKYTVNLTSEIECDGYPKEITNLCKGDKLTEENLKITSKDPNYTLIAWKNGNEVINAGYEISKSLTLKAEWKRMGLIVNFDINGATGSQPKQIFVKQGQAPTTLEFPTLEKDGFVKNSYQWVVEADPNIVGGTNTDGKLYFKNNSNPTLSYNSKEPKEITLVARMWKPNKPIITGLDTREKKYTNNFSNTEVTITSKGAKQSAGFKYKVENYWGQSIPELPNTLDASNGVAKVKANELVGYLNEYQQVLFVKAVSEEGVESDVTQFMYYLNPIITIVSKDRDFGNGYATGRTKILQAPFYDKSTLTKNYINDFLELEQPKDNVEGIKSCHGWSWLDETTGQPILNKAISKDITIQVVWETEQQRDFRIFNDKFVALGNIQNFLIEVPRKEGDFYRRTVNPTISDIVEYIDFNKVSGKNLTNIYIKDADGRTSGIYNYEMISTNSDFSIGRIHITSGSSPIKEGNYYDVILTPEDPNIKAKMIYVGTDNTAPLGQNQTIGPNSLIVSKQDVMYYNQPLVDQYLEKILSTSNLMYVSRLDKLAIIKSYKNGVLEFKDRYGFPVKLTVEAVLIRGLDTTVSSGFIVDVKLKEDKKNMFDPNVKYSIYNDYKNDEFMIKKCKDQGWESKPIAIVAPPDRSFGYDDMVDSY